MSDNSKTDKSSVIDKIDEETSLSKKTNKKLKKTDKNSASEKRKRLYVRLFFYAFCGTFIIGGLIILTIFLNTKNPDLFGTSNKYYEQALLLYKSGDYEEAEKILNKCINANGENADAIVLLADIYQTQGKSDEAITLLRDSINFSGRNEKNETLYKKVIQLYTAQNRIAEAYDFYDNADSYIRQRLESTRPADLKISPDAGSYDSVVNVSIEPEDGCTVYYSLDGNLPTKDSPPYIPEETEIKIDSGSVVLTAFAINELGMLSDKAVLQYIVYNDNTKYEFKDSKMEAIIRANLKKPSGTILYKDIATLSALTNKLSSISSDSDIQSLDDLIAMTNLRELSLYGENSISDFSILKSMNSLSSLTLDDCNITGEIAKIIYSMKNITSLNLADNGLSDISGIAEMTNLVALDISGNSISDMSALSNIAGLATLKIANNNLTELSSLPTKSGLTELDISSNMKLTSLSGVEKLSRLQTLNASETAILSINELSSNRQLLNLNIASTSVSDISVLRDISSLSTLNISNTLIPDLSPLSVTYLKTLTAKNSGITDVSALSQIMVETLDISGNAITDISPLSTLSRLKIIDISKTYVTNIEKLSACASLSKITCEGVSVSDTAMTMLVNKGIKVIN